MKRAIIIGLVAVAAGSHTAERLIPRVIVCMEAAPAAQILEMAQQQTGTIFARIGVQVEFHNYYGCPRGPEEHIMIRLEHRTDPSVHPGALAYAEPFAGAPIRVFYDRVERTVDSQTIPVLLAHVLAHEIAHIIERSNSHSDSGIMKRHWDPKDYAEMRQHRLTFTEGDIIQIHISLATQALATPAGEKW